MKRVYSLYPSLLNNWHLFLTEAGYSRGDDENEEQVLFVPDERAVLDMINRKPTPTTDAQRSGQLFEDAVLNRIPTPTGAEERTVKQVQALLPAFYRADVLTIGRYTIAGAEVTLYGKIDVIGAGRIVDIKQTSRYSLNKFYNSHQLFYLHNTYGAGIKTMSFVINHKNTVHVERYRPADVDWSALEGEISLFIEFLEQHREQVTDKRIFTDISHETVALRAFGYDPVRKQIGSF